MDVLKLAAKMGVSLSDPIRIRGNCESFGHIAALFLSSRPITSENKKLGRATDQEKHPSAVSKQSIEGMLQELLEISVAEK
jgi:hypothetical protein